MTYKASDHTFVVCAYGESTFLDECVKSVCFQELITNVIVSTSTPNEFIANVCEKYSVPLWVNDGEPGIGKDWNRALSHVETSLATIAHQDDVYLPSYSEKLLSAFNEAENPLLFFCDYGEIRRDQNADSSCLLNVKRVMLSPLKNKCNWNNIFLRRRILSLGSAISCPSVSFNLDVIPRPIFNEEMKCSLDWEAWERISRMDGAFVYEPTIQMRHRIHENSETSHLINDNTRTNEDYEMMRRFWPRPIAYLINKAYRVSQSSNSLK